MANSDRMTLKAVGKLLGVELRDISKARPYLQGFPEGEKAGRLTVYSAKAVEAWAKGKDVASLVKAALAEDRRGEKPASALNQMARRMAAGEFATADQKQRYGMKKLVARNCRRQPVNRITVRPDWMND